MAEADADLDRIYLSYVGPIRNYLRRLSGDPELAEDLVQEVFYRAMRQFWAGARVRYISAWLYRIARNLYLDHVRRVSLSQVSLDEVSERAPEVIPPHPDGPEEEVLRREKRHRIAAAIARLSEAQRTVIILRDIHGLSHEEIADVMDLSVGAVKSCLHRARRRFAEVYGDEEG